MTLRTCVLFLAASLAAAAQLIPGVRAAIKQGDFAQAEKMIAEERSRTGVTPQVLEAFSWLGRGALAAKQLDQADAYARKTRDLVLAELKKRPLDGDANTPIALGASIEVQAQVLDARGERGAAVAFLRNEVKAYWNTSIRTRIQKNINLLSLEGKPAPALEMTEWLASKPMALKELKGRPVLLFFWAHWCGDCKAESPIVARLAQTYGPKGLAIVGPTQRYGYVARGEDATPAQEKPYIESIRRQSYAAIPMTVPLSEENFRNYGASSTPTLVLLDREGIVRMYHPGSMSYEELAAQVEKLAGK